MAPSLPETKEPGDPTTEDAGTNSTVCTSPQHLEFHVEPRTTATPPTRWSIRAEKARRRGGVPKVDSGSPARAR